MKNWKTGTVGIVSLLVAIYHCYAEGKIDLMCIWVALQSAGWFLTKDYNVTGGTVPSGTPESIVRVTEGANALSPGAVARASSKLP